MQNPLTIEHCKQAMYDRISSGVYANVGEKLKGHTAWNKGLTGDGQPMFGRHHSEETKKKMSEAAKHRKYSED